MARGSPPSHQGVRLRRGQRALRRGVGVRAWGGASGGRGLDLDNLIKDWTPWRQFPDRAPGGAQPADDRVDERAVNRQPATNETPGAQIKVWLIEPENRSRMKAHWGSGRRESFRLSARWNNRNQSRDNLASLIAACTFQQASSRARASSAISSTLQLSGWSCR